MKRLLLGLTLLSSPALAVEPTPGKDDPHICDVAYSTSTVVAISASAGDNIGIRFDPAETILDVSLSDTENMARSLSAGPGNVVYLKSKAVNGMAEQPFIIRTRRADGTSREYTFQWKAFPLNVTSSLALRPTVECYLIRFTYPADVTAAQAAAWRARKARADADEAEIALHRDQQARQHNVRYVAQGDASIGPTEIWDDGNTTTLVWPGNMKIPVILTRLADRKTDAEVTGFTVEQDGVVKVHGTLPFLRLRTGDQVLCIYNLGYSAIGINPGTGTTSSEIERGVGGHHP